MTVEEELNKFAVLIISYLDETCAPKLIAKIKKACTRPNAKQTKIKYLLAERLCAEYIHPADAVMWSTHRADPTLTNIIENLRTRLLLRIAANDYTEDICFIPLSDLLMSVYRVESMDIGADLYTKKDRDIYRHNFYWNMGLRLLGVLSDAANYDAPKN